MKISEEILTPELTEELSNLLNHQSDTYCGMEDEVLNPIWSVYAMEQQMDRFKGFLVRHEDKIVAYAGYFVSPNLHYRNLVVATQDVFFVDTEKAPKSCTMVMIKFIEQQLKEGGVDVIIQYAVIGSGFEGILPKYGYEPKTSLYYKRVN